MTLKKLFKKYWHALFLIYFLLYMPYFTFLNTYTPSRDNIFYMYSKLDDLIPFCELFVIPYFLWFAYIAIGYCFFFLVSRKEFIRLCIFLYTGMTVCLIIYTIFPNGQNLRVNYDELGRDNFLIYPIKTLQSYDTAFNVFPSIHCLNSFAMHIAIHKSKHISKHRKPIVIGSLILTILIVLSTVFTKQHSILDVFGAIILAIPLYLLAYLPKYKLIKD